MTTTLPELMRPAREELISRFIDHTIADNVPFYVGLPREELRARVARLVDSFTLSTADGPQPLIAFVSQVAALRAREGASVDEMQQMATMMRRAALSVVDEATLDPATHLALSRTIENLVEAGRIEISRAYTRHFQQVIADLSEREQTIQLQSRVIRELSTPVLPVLDDVLVMPLVGAIDSLRASQITERLLEGVSASQSSLVILDITAVPMVDMSIAQHLLGAVRAVGLLGARCVLVGVRPEVAQALVSIGADLSSLSIQRDLKAGLLYVLRQRGLLQS
jgi:rsbT co-antagonist protein RsbR